MRALFADVMAWKSPGEVQVDVIHGQHLGVPAAGSPPPSCPGWGPREGSRRAIITLCPARAKESASPTVVVDLPSPAGGVGDMAETSTTLPGGAFPWGGSTSLARLILAL